MGKTLSLRNQAILLTAGRFSEQAIQLLTPIFLIRFIDSTEFGYYRLFWLLVGTIMVLMPLGMPRSLLYFLPSLNEKLKSSYVSQTFMFLIFAGIISAILVGPWNSLLPEDVQKIVGQNYFVVAFFIFFWVLGSLIEFLPNAMQKIRWQAGVLFFLAIIRITLLLFAAINFHSLSALLYALLCFSFIRFLLLVYFLIKNINVQLFAIKSKLFKDQLYYAVPFGLTDSLYVLRKVFEQWIVAFLFNAASFAAFSLASTLIIPFNIIRSSITSLLLPRMSEGYSGGELDKIVALNKKGVASANALLYPVLAYVFLFADQIVEFLFTKNYMDASVIIRVYVIQIAIALDIGAYMNILRQGRFVLKYNMLILLLSIICSFLGAIVLGLIGAAIGSLLAGAVDIYIVVRRITTLLSIRLSDFQHWKLMFFLFISSVLSMLITNTLYAHFIEIFPLWLELIFGAITVGVSYVLLLTFFGYKWIVLFFLNKQNWKEV